MITPIYDTSIPSHAIPLLSSLVGRKLVNMVRFNYHEIEHLLEVFEIEPKDFFSFSLGAILFYFEDGLVFGGSSNPHENTVVVWVEKNEIGETTEWLQEQDLTAKPFYAQDFERWKDFLGQTISSVKILKQIDIYNENSKIDNLPSERGVILNFENGLSLIISHGLNDNSDDTTIIFPYQIAPYFKDRLVYIDL